MRIKQPGSTSVPLAVALAITSVFLGLSVLYLRTGDDLPHPTRRADTAVETTPRVVARLYFDTSCGTQLYFGAKAVSKHRQAAAPALVATVARIEELRGRHDDAGVLLTFRMLKFDADAAVPDLSPLIDSPHAQVRNLAVGGLEAIFDPRNLARVDELE